MICLDISEVNNVIISNVEELIEKLIAQLIKLNKGLNKEYVN